MQSHLSDILGGGNLRELHVSEGTRLPKWNGVLLTNIGDKFKEGDKVEVQSTVNSDGSVLVRIKKGNTEDTLNLDSRQELEEMIAKVK